MSRWIFKILRYTEWQTAKSTDHFAGSPADMADGFIHFSTFDQLADTINKHFDSDTRIELLAFDPALWPETLLRWEPSRGGALFPHLYGPLDVSQAACHWSLNRSDQEAFDLSGPEKWTACHD